MNIPSKSLSVLLFLLPGWAGVQGQELITPLVGNPVAAAYYLSPGPEMKSAMADTLELPFFDDFSTSFVAPDPGLWSDRHAFVNNNFCVLPPTNGVATLDALDYQGNIYPGATLDPRTFEADHLSSHPIRLDYPAGDSIYFSFLFQPEGLGEEPDAQDSLLVDFYDVADSAWINVWGSPGTGLQPFRHAMIAITDPRFLTRGFRFRFRNLASLPRNNDYPDKRANVDHWHVDYVRLGRERTASDTILRDVAFVTALSSPLKDLSSLPWAHFEAASNTVLDPVISVRYRNNDTLSHNITRSLLIEEPWYHESFIPVVPTAQDIPPLTDTIVVFDYIYPLDFNRGDSALVRFTASLRTDESDPKVNDTVIYDQLFRDYYAYDDGTPEAGYGLRGQGTRNGSVAQKFHAYESAELGGVDISFNQLLDSVNLGYYFTLMVWGDNEGLPGSALLEDEEDYTPVYPEHFPGFVRYHFSQPVPVEGTFYVGWSQYNEYMLNVGLDLNNRPSPHVLFYNYQGTWESSKAPGVILIRPFLYDPSTGTPPEQKADDALHIYPNPTCGYVHMEIPGMNAPAGLDLEAYDSTGRMVGSWKVRDGYLDLSHLPAGIYYLRCRHAGRLYHAKLLIQP